MNYFFKILFFLLVTLSSIRVCYAQDPVYFKIGEKEFANTEVYSVLYDEINDIIYAGTNNGLYAYKQNRFVRIQQAENQKGKSVFLLKQNRKGEIFCNNLSGQILTVHNNHLELVYQSTEKTKSSYFWYYFIENNRLLVVTNNTIKKILKNGKEKTLLNTPSTIIYSNKTSYGIAFYIKIYEKGNYILNYKNNQLQKIQHTKAKEIDAIDNFIVQKNKMYAKDKYGKLLNLSKTPLIVDFKPQLKESFYSINNNLVIGLSVQKGARYIYLNKDTLTASKPFLQNTFLSAFATSTKGTLLFGTFNDGIIVVPNYKVTKTTKKDELFLGITTTPNNTVGISTRSGAIYSYKNKNLQQIDKVPHNVDAIYYFNHINSKSNPKNIFIYNKIGSEFIGSKDVVRINSNVFLYSTQSGIILKNFNSDIPVKKLDYLGVEIKGYSPVPKQRVNALAWNKKDSLIYFSTNDGLFKKGWSTSKITKILINNKPFLASGISFKNDTLVCSSNQGVFFLKNDKPVFKLTKKEGLLHNSVKQVQLKNKILYILTHKGMQLYNLKTKQFLGFGIKEGVVAQNVKKFTLSDDVLWLLEKNSFSSVAINSLKKSQKNTVSKLFIDSVSVNNQKINFLKQKQFPYTENRLDFFIDYRNIETKSETKIYYTLEGFYDDWKTIPTTQNKIEFQSLPTGNYTFKVKANYRNTETKPFVYSFVISPPFFKTWWFYALLTIIGLFILYYRFKQLKKQNKTLLEKQELKTTILDSELKALRSQMNPHFIFNSLNSIQGLILQQKTNESYDYIVLFSNLVRNTLNYSSKDFITIQNELDFLKIYLQLEKLRFGSDFTYTIKYVGNKDIRVPSLIVQPFIENALLHGLLHKIGDKKLEITFQLKNNTLTCTIIDNGVGRKKAKTIQERQGKRHTSFALKAITRRLKILSEKTGHLAQYTTTDLYDYDIAKGTKIEISMPFELIF